MPIETFLDFETTGFPNKSLPKDHQDQPHPVAIGMIVRNCTETGQRDVVMTLKTFIACPIEVPEGAKKVHGIEQETTIKHGIMPNKLLDLIVPLIANSDILIAHNMEFDRTILEIMAERADIRFQIPKTFCTMLEYAQIFNDKWPKLDDAFTSVAADREGDYRPHDPLDDCKKCMHVYDGLIIAKKRLGNDQRTD